MKNLSELVKQAEIKRKKDLKIGALILLTMGSLLALTALIMAGLAENYNTETAWHLINVFGLLVALFGAISLKNNQ